MSNELLWKMCVHIKYDNNAVYSHVKQEALQQSVCRHHAMITAGVLHLWPYILLCLWSLIPTEL